MFKKLGDWCEGFVTVDEDIVLLSHLQWARILVKYDGRVLPKSLQVVVGCSSFSIQLWWEAPPRFSMVASRSSCSGYFGHEEGMMRVVHTPAWE